MSQAPLHLSTIDAKNVDPNKKKPLKKRVFYETKLKT